MRFTRFHLFQALRETRRPRRARPATADAGRLPAQGSNRFVTQVSLRPSLLAGSEKGCGSVCREFQEAGSPLSDQILKVAREAAAAVKADGSLVIGITAVAFMTVQQVGLDAFKNAKGEMLLDKKFAKKSPEQVLRERAVDDSQGFLVF